MSNFSSTIQNQIPFPNLLIKLSLVLSVIILIGGWGAKTERSGDPHRESKPSAQRQRTARTTRQINGAKSFGG